MSDNLRQKVKEAILMGESTDYQFNGENEVPFTNFDADIATDAVMELLGRENVTKVYQVTQKDIYGQEQYQDQIEAIEEQLKDAKSRLNVMQNHPPEWPGFDWNKAMK